MLTQTNLESGTLASLDRNEMLIEKQDRIFQESIEIMREKGFKIMPVTSEGKLTLDSIREALAKMPKFDQIGQPPAIPYLDLHHADLKDSVNKTKERMDGMMTSLFAYAGVGRSLLGRSAGMIIQDEFVMGVDLAKGPDYSVVDGEAIPNPHWGMMEMPFSIFEERLMAAKQMMGNEIEMDTLKMLEPGTPEDSATIRKRNKNNMAEFLRSGGGKRRRW